jgi:aminoglycoside phosphotransferase (APT) family kinase protein
MGDVPPARASDQAAAASGALVPAADAVDLDALRRWLAAHRPDLPSPVAVSRFTRGHSNETLLIRAAEGPGYVLRRPPAGVHIEGAHDMAREHRVLSAVARVTDRVPTPYGLCDDPAVLGRPFLLMERVDGLIVRHDPPERLPEQPEVWARISGGLVDGLADLHRLPAAEGPLTAFGHPEGYVARQVAGWKRRYRAARTPDVPDLESLVAWLEGHLPEDAGLAGCALVHNDYKYDNVVLDADDPTRVRAVLDWELATRGDPRSDLGTALAYWAEFTDPAPWRRLRFGPTDVPGSLTRTQVVERWARRTGRDPGDPVWWFVFGLFKVAGIFQQLYARTVDDVSDDPRLPAMRERVVWCATLADRAISRGRISDLGGP